MAEEAEETTPEVTAKPPIMLAFIVGLVGAAIGGGGAFVAISQMPPPQAAPVEEAVEEDAEPEASFADRVHALDPFVVNVSGEGYPRYVKLSLAFEMDSPASKEELEAHIAKVRDLTILLISSKRLADIEDFEGKALLKDDLRERVNAVISKGNVESVLFTEFVVQ
ncbi:MAG: flagellar basal body-associated FliL family protein [Myxococcota bacterium]